MGTMNCRCALAVLIFAMAAGCVRNELYNNTQDDPLALIIGMGSSTPHLAINPTTRYLQKGESFVFSATGGMPPYTFSIVSGSGTIIPDTGLYMAPGIPDTTVIRVTDKTGVTRDASVETLAGPDDIAPASLRLWLKADAITTLSHNDPVVTWPDSSGNAFDATQSVAGQQPVFLVNFLNGRPVVRFDNAATPGNHLTLGGNYLFSTGSGVTIFALCRSSTASGGSTWQFIFDFGYLAPNGYGFSYKCDGGRFYTPTGAGLGGVDTPYTISTPRSTAEFVILCLVIEFNTNERLYLNGGVLFSLPITTLQLTAAEIDENPTRDLAAGPVTIGGQSKTQLEAGRFFNGDIAEIIYFDTAMSDAERTSIEYYLERKWGR